MAFSGDDACVAIFLAHGALNSLRTSRKLSVALLKGSVILEWHGMHISAAGHDASHASLL